MAKVHPINMGAYRRFSPYIWAPGMAYLGSWEGLFGTPYGPGPAQELGHLNVPQAGIRYISSPGGAQIGVQNRGPRALNGLILGPKYRG